VVLASGRLACPGRCGSHWKNQNDSEATVKSHVNHMLPKIGARDRAQAVGYAHRHGLVPS
jgi:Bacterial regulatory proteins, luxR family